MEQNDRSSCNSSLFTNSLLAAQECIVPILATGDQKEDVQRLIEACMNALNSNCFYFRVTKWEIVKKGEERNLSVYYILKHVPSSECAKYHLEYPMGDKNPVEIHQVCQGLVLSCLLFPSFKKEDLKVIGPCQQQKLTNCG